MPRPVCVRCHVEFRVEKTGAVADFHARSVGGTYEAWASELWKCPGCGAQILAGYGRQPITRHTNASHKYTVGVAGAIKVYEDLVHRVEEEGPINGAET